MRNLTVSQSFLFFNFFLNILNARLSVNTTAKETAGGDKIFYG